MTMLDDRPDVYVAPDSHRAHGTHAKYVVERCKCGPCKTASREYEKARLRAMSRPDEVWVPYVPAGRARRHVEQLMAQGVGPKSVAVLSGVPHGAISKLVYGNYRGRGPSKRIRPETEAKLLAVTVADARGHQKIPAGPTWLLLDDLIRRGYTKQWLGRVVTKNPTARSLQVSRNLVYARTARRVEALHRLLGDKPGPGRRSPWPARRAKEATS